MEDFVTDIKTQTLRYLSAFNQKAIIVSSVASIFLTVLFVLFLSKDTNWSQDDLAVFGIILIVPFVFLLFAALINTLLYGGYLLVQQRRLKDTSGLRLWNMIIFYCLITFIVAVLLSSPEIRHSSFMSLILFLGIPLFYIGACFYPSITFFLSKYETSRFAKITCVVILSVVTIAFTGQVFVQRQRGNDLSKIDKIAGEFGENVLVSRALDSGGGCSINSVYRLNDNITSLEGLLGKTAGEMRQRSINGYAYKEKPHPDNLARPWDGINKSLPLSIIKSPLFDLESKIRSYAGQEKYNYILVFLQFKILSGKIVDILRLYDSMSDSFENYITIRSQSVSFCGYK